MTQASARRSANVTWQLSGATREQRWSARGHDGATLWFTGLPASGKSTVAAALEARLTELGASAYLLDGDNLRHGLNGDLGFDEAARRENIRRTAHVARLLADAGVVALASLVSPFAADRDRARQMHEDEEILFLEVHVATPLEVCERRDPKGLYAKARRGELVEFTGVSAPYEPPRRPDLRVAETDSVLDAAERCLAALRDRGWRLRSPAVAARRS